VPTHTNIELFEQVVGRCLLKLYQGFPTPIDLEPGRIGVEVATELDLEDEDSAVLILSGADHAVGFLVREGFIHFNPQSRVMTGPKFPGAVLTLKGLHLLGKVPSSVDSSVDNRPLADRLGDAVKDGARASIADAVKAIISGAFVAVGSAVG